jgi:hypothetical protein
VSDGQQWRKSTRSNASNSCVEINRTLDALRDSKNTIGPVLHFADLAAVPNFVRQVAKP